MGKHIDFKELDQLMSSYGFKSITELWSYINYLEREQKYYESLKYQITTLTNTVNHLCQERNKINF